MHDIEALTLEEERTVERLRSLVGTRLDGGAVYDALHGVVPFISEVNLDAINHYAWAIDDLNPLWMEREYALGSALRAVVAPPSIIVQLCPGGMGGCLMFPLNVTFGTHETWGGARMRWHEWFSAGMKIRAESRLAEVGVKHSRRSGVLIQLTADTEFFDQTGRLVAEAAFWIFRKRSQSYGQSFADVKMKHWSPAEISAVRNEQQRYRRRGAEPRYWDDVRSGDTFELLKGPYSMMANMCFLSMCSPQRLFRGDVAWAEAEREEQASTSGRLDNLWANPLGFPDVANAHWDSQQAQRDGLPGAFDYGTQRASWATQLLTDWMGDAGFLESFEFQVRGFNCVGDLQRFTGTVSGKREDGHHHFVDCVLDVTNQRGEQTALGSAVVRLPEK